MPVNISTIVNAAALAFGLALGGAAFAADTGNSGSSGDTNDTAAKTAECKTQKKTAGDADWKQWIWSVSQNKCVKQTALNDVDRYEAGRALALAGDHREALDLLNAVSNKNDARVLTMIGYATRKLGDVAGGIAIYHQALAIDPNNVNTHEYLGEGYLTAGRVDLAEVELDTLAKLCGVECPQYKQLQGAIAGDGVWH